jgi:hypothetical protein
MDHQDQRAAGFALDLAARFIEKGLVWGGDTPRSSILRNLSR